MTPFLSMSGAEVGAWIGALLGLLALINQGWGLVKKRRAERAEIEEALDHTPEVRQQLALGNVGEAVKHLNVIINSQASHTKDQDRKLESNAREIERLKDRNDALEAEAQGWQRKYEELERLRAQDRQEADRKIAELMTAQEDLKKTFGRTLSQLRQQLAEQEPGEMT